MSEKSEYERLREERIARNKQQLQALNVPKLVPQPSRHKCVAPLFDVRPQVAFETDSVTPFAEPVVKKPAGQQSKKRAAPLLHTEPVRFVDLELSCEVGLA